MPLYSILSHFKYLYLDEAWQAFQARHSIAFLSLFYLKYGLQTLAFRSCMMHCCYVFDPSSDEIILYWCLILYLCKGVTWNQLTKRSTWKILASPSALDLSLSIRCLPIRPKLVIYCLTFLSTKSTYSYIFAWSSVFSW